LAGLPVEWSEIGGGIPNWINAHWKQAVNPPVPRLGIYPKKIDANGPHGLSWHNYDNIVKGFADADTARNGPSLTDNTSRAPPALPVAPSNDRSSFGDRFGKWGSSPAASSPPPATDPPGSFDNRFGSWGSVPTGSFGETRSPVLRALEKYRRSDVPDGAVSTSAQAEPPAAPALQPDIAGKRPMPVRGKFIGDRLIAPAAAASPSGPLLTVSIPPNLLREQSGFGDRSEKAPGAPSPDPRLRRVSSAFPDITPPNPNQPVPPQRSPPLGIFSGKPMPQWLLPPSVWGVADNSDASGNGDWFNFLAGIAARNATQPAPPPQDDGLRDVYGDDPTRPWTLQRRR
jgi:hypothetical protein